MRIVVNDVAAVPGSGGVFSILEDFYNKAVNISKKNKEISWTFILAGKFFPEYENVEIIVRKDLKDNKFKRIFFEFFSGRKYIDALRPDAYVSLQNTMTIGLNDDIKKWVYLHQALSFQSNKSFSFFKKKERKLAFHQHIMGPIIDLTLKKSQPNVIIQTKWMKKAILDKKITDAKHAFLIPPIIKVMDEPKGDTAKLQTNNFFYPATPMIYKNHEILFKASKILDREGYMHSVTCTITKNDVEKLGLSEGGSVRLVGNISRHEVMSKYKENVLIFPSYIETFGLPLLEAKMSNDVILAADTSFSHEILDDYEKAYFFKYDSVNDLVNLMRNSIVGKLDNKKNGSYKVKKYDSKNNLDFIELIINETKK